MEPELNEIFLRHGYSVDKAIGQGKFGIVYRVKSLKYDQDFVVKMVLKESICHEIETMMNLYNFYILKIFDYWEEGRFIFMVMNYCSNGSMQEYIKTHDALSKEQFKTWSRQVLEALHFCHEKGIAHRDIKPANILIDEYNRMQLADFGLSIKVDVSQNHHGIMGTISTMAPEVLKNQSYDLFAADVWSMGATLYFMYYGRFPFILRRTDTISEVAEIVSTIDIKYPRTSDPEVVTVLKRMLQKRPEDRLKVSEILKLPLYRKNTLQTPPNKRSRSPGVRRNSSALIRALSNGSFIEGSSTSPSPLLTMSPTFGSNSHLPPLKHVD